jgi:hypothetical protein
MSGDRRIVPGLMVALLLGGCSSGEVSSTALEESELGPTAVSTSTSTARSQAAVACQSQPAATEEIFVWSTDPELPPYAWRLGGGWTWNVAEKRCMTSVEFALASNPPGEDFCTQVGLVSENPGYDTEATPAPRLQRIVAEAGDCS